MAAPAGVGWGTARAAWSAGALIARRLSSNSNTASRVPIPGKRGHGSYLMSIRSAALALICVLGLHVAPLGEATIRVAKVLRTVTPNPVAESAIFQVLCPNGRYG